MKKFAFLSLSALMMLAASCSDEKETPRPPVPTDPVVTVPSVADQVTLDLPEQNPDFVYENGLYTFKYSNGQELSFSMGNDATIGYYAIVRKITGAAEVVVPPTVTAVVANTGATQVYNVIAFNLYQNGMEGVKKLTVSKGVNVGYDNNVLGDLTDKWLCSQIKLLPDLEAVELETGFPGYCSIDGSIYTSDLTTIVAVPRAKSGVFTLAQNTKNVADRTFYYCSKLTAITFPAAVESIGAEAVTYNDMLVLINMEPTVSPETESTSFGAMAQTGLLRIPVGSRDSYFPAKPELVRPVPPTEPADDCTIEEYEEYEIQEAQYQADLKAYNAAMAIYDRPVGFRNFTKVEEVTF